jgi:hypothetical protein
MFRIEMLGSFYCNFNMKCVFAGISNVSNK